MRLKCRNQCTQMPKNYKRPWKGLGEREGATFEPKNKIRTLSQRGSWAIATTILFIKHERDRAERIRELGLSSVCIWHLLKYLRLSRTHINTRTLDEGGPWWLRTTSNGESVSLCACNCRRRVFSERVFTTNKDVNFFPAGDSRIFISSFAPNAFSHPKACPCVLCVLSCQRLTPVLLESIFLSHFIFILSPSLDAAAACVWLLFILRHWRLCPVRTSGSLGCLGKETSATSDTATPATPPAVGHFVCLDWCDDEDEDDQRTKYSPPTSETPPPPGHMTNDDRTSSSNSSSSRNGLELGVKASFVLALCLLV